MSKFGIGESVRFKAPELLVSSGGYSFKIGTDGLVGKVTCSVETIGEETKYHVEVKLPRSLSESVSCILGISYSSDVTLMLSALESQLQSEKEYSDSKLSRLSDLEFDEFVKRVIPSFNPDPDSWIRLDDGGPFVKESFDATLALKKWKPIPNRYFMCADLSRPDVVASFQLSKEALDSVREFARTGNVHHSDGLVPADGGDKKMSKSRCVKLLESYRAEREKIKKGRKFERRLRDSVVDEALERAIELLKGGAE